MFFAFRSEIDRDRAMRAIAQQPSLGTSLPGGRDVASACGSILEVGCACCRQMYTMLYKSLLERCRLLHSSHSYVVLS